MGRMSILGSRTDWCVLGTLVFLTAGCGEGELRASAPILASSVAGQTVSQPTLDEGRAFESRMTQGQNLLATERFAEAKDVFAAALELDPGNTEALLGLADSERNLRELPQAQRHFEEVLGLSAERDELLTALSGLAVVHREMGNTQAAADLTAEAEALRGNDASLR
jgi:tetratricopeptide (TPR) repeat protein